MTMSRYLSNRVTVWIFVMLVSEICHANEGADSELQASSSYARTDLEADHDALRALIPKYEQAANEGKLEVLKPYLAPEFSGVMVTGDEVDSFASLEDYWHKMQKLMGEGGKYHVQVDVAARSILSGDLAVAHGTTADQVVTSRGKEYRFEGRWTAVCRKHDGQWKVLRIHGSMDPIFNPFVTAAVRGSSIFAGAVAGVVGLAIGLAIHVLHSRRREAAAST